jgi:dCTP deaminase
MILSNIEIANALQKKHLKILDLASNEPSQPPFNTSSVDLRLSPNLSVPKSENVGNLRPSKVKIAPILARDSQTVTLTDNQPYMLKPNCFILGKTIERVEFPISSDHPCYAARVEGRSSLARCEILVHFTAPTIHAGFEGTITLEIINLGPYEILLEPGMYICQLIVEEVKGTPILTTSQFRGQTETVGNL